MAQIQVRDQGGNPVPRINIRISEGTKTSEEAIFDVFTDLAGNTGWPIPFWPNANYTLHVNRQNVDPRFGTVERFIPFDPDGYEDIFIELPPVGQVPPPTGPLVPLTVDRSVFRADNAIFRWKFCDAFILPQRHALGQDISEFLHWVRSTGFNGIRCFTAMYTVPRIIGLPPYILTPEEIARFLDEVAAWGLRCELTVGDMQILLPNHEDQVLYFRARAEVTRHYPGVVDETCNEPFKNGVDVGRIGIFGDALQASGDYDYDTMVPLDYITVHPERKSEWPRTAKDGVEYYDRWHRPVVMDEGVGAGERLITWSRSNVPGDFFDFAATSALFCAGATFHFEDGLFARRPGPVQQQCAEQFVAGLNSIDIGACLGSYTRGGLSTCPIQHSDTTALRTFGRIMGSRAEVVVVRPTEHQASDRVPVNGWYVTSTEGERNNIVHLAR